MDVAIGVMGPLMMSNGAAGGEATEMLSAIKTIASLGLEETACARYEAVPHTVHALSYLSAFDLRRSAHALCGALTQIGACVHCVGR